MTRLPLSLTVLILAVAALLAGVPIPRQRVISRTLPQHQAVCNTPAYHQFDFWIGDWDAFDMDKPTVMVARNHVDRILDGCVLREDYSGNDGLQGQSFTIYDASRKVWHQTWVTNRGKLLVIEGRLQSSEIILTGIERTPEGKQREVRGVWKPVVGGVRETAITSTDAGRTWQLWFDIIFRPHRP